MNLRRGGRGARASVAAIAVALALAFALAAVLAAGAGAPGASAAVARQAQAPTLTPGTLVVGLSMPTAGFQVGIVNGRDVLLAEGLEADLARAVAAGLAVPAVRFVNATSFRTLISAGPKDWDIGIAQLTVTAARRADVDFSRPYFRADQGVLMRPGRSLKPRTLARLARLRLCAQRGSTGADLIAARVQPTRKVRLAGNPSRLEADLYHGRCDAIVGDAPSLGALRARAPERVGRLAGRIPTGERWAISLPKGSSLRPAVDDALRALERDGTLARLQRTWLTTDTETLPVIR